MSAWYPTDAAPVVGTFVEKDVALLARDHDVEVVHLVAPHLRGPGPRTVVRNGITVHRVTMSPQRPDHVLRARRELGPLLRGADLVHTAALPTLLAFALRRPQAPWVHTEHWSGLSNPESLPRAWRLALPVLRRLLRGPDVVTAVSENLAGAVSDVRGADRPTTIVPCLVPPPVPLPERRRTDRLRLVAVGGLVARKGPDVAVAALAELRARGHEAELTWVGEGPLRAEVTALAQRLGVLDHVHLPGSTDAAGVSAALGAADLMLLPTQAENFCVAAAEALVHGRPVVVGARGGQREYVDASVGALVETHDPVAYAEAVLAVDARTRDLSAAQVAATIGDRFGERAVRDGYAAAYATARGTRAPA